MVQARTDLCGRLMTISAHVRSSPGQPVDAIVVAPDARIVQARRGNKAIVPRLRHKRLPSPGRPGTLPPMRIGVLVPTRGVVMESARRPPVEACWTMARRADQAGYDAVWVGDSIVAKPRLDALTTLAYLAGITTQVRLGTAVLLPALRHPVVLAQQLANIDQISRGRLLLGLGVGWSLPSAAREWAACGADHKARVRRLEEHIEIWRQLWTGEPVTHHGHDVDLVDHTIGPLPWQPEGPAHPDHRGQPRRAAARPARAPRAPGRRHHHDLRARRGDAGPSASGRSRRSRGTAGPVRTSRSACTPPCGSTTTCAPPSG